MTPIFACRAKPSAGGQAKDLVASLQVPPASQKRVAARHAEKSWQEQLKVEEEAEMRASKRRRRSGSEDSVADSEPSPNVRCSVIVRSCVYSIESTHMPAQHTLPFT